MSLRYMILEPHPVRCETCGGHGSIAGDLAGDADSETCWACDGSGRTGEVTWEPHSSAQLYDTPGKAHGVVKRQRKLLGLDAPQDGRDYRLLVVDTDACEPLGDRWPLDRQFEIAAERALFWADRALALQPRVSRGIRRHDAGEAVTVATDAILAGRLDDAREILAGARPEEPRLDAAELEIVRLALDVVVRLGGPDGVGMYLGVQAHLLEEPQVARARAVLAKLDACAALEELHRRSVRGAAETTEALARWATGAEGSRRCFRDPLATPPVAPGWAWTACGDLVPAPAATDDPARVACPTCDGVAASYTAALARP